MENKSEQSSPEQLSEKQTQIIAAQYEAPIPPPQYLEAYERIVPGAADRILTMAEKSLDAQIEQNQTRLELFKRGQTIASIVTLSGLALVAVGAFTQQNPAIYAGIITSLVSFLPKIFPASPPKNKK